jgi:hypothetical protein
MRSSSVQGFCWHAKTGKTNARPLRRVGADFPESHAARARAFCAWSSTLTEVSSTPSRVYARPARGCRGWVSPAATPTPSPTQSVDLPSNLSHIAAWPRVALSALTGLTPPLAPTTLTPLHMLTGSHRSKGGAYDGPTARKLESASVPETSHAGGSRGGVRRVPKADRCGRVAADAWTARPVFGAGWMPTARRQSPGYLPELLQPPVSGDVTSLVAGPSASPMPVSVGSLRST